ncbi:MAG: phospholipase D family protein [Cytophagales bacterium]|jgi:phosphatidylserine/phosphatidylglycerophosphate/cardiolipin synthase-like enzyme|nr:phospholipase D family protein [Cytophagales bacterium]
MAKLLKTNGISHHLDQIIDGAKEKLYLVSPYLKFNERIRKSLEDADRIKLDFRIVYGKDDLLPKEKEWIRTLESVKLECCTNLHAKCYLNENEAVITSMNLYDYSQVNNQELGVYITRKNDFELYKDLHDEVLRMIRSCDDAPQFEKKAVAEKKFG